MKSYVLIDSSNLIYSGIYACLTKAGISPISSMEQYFSTRLTDIAITNNKLLEGQDADVKFIFVEDGYKGNTRKSNILREVTNEGYKANRDASVEVTEYRESDNKLVETKKRKKLDFNAGKQALYNVINRLVNNCSATVNIITEEADDIIASLVYKIQKTTDSYKILIMSADVDILQLSDSKNIFQYSHIRRKILDTEYLEKTLGIKKFEHIAIYKTFIGDSGDNINVRFVSSKGRIRVAAFNRILNAQPVNINLDNLADIVEKEIALDEPINRENLHKIYSIVKLDTTIDLDDNILAIEEVKKPSNDFVFI